MSQSCAAPAGLSAADWLRRGESLLGKRPAQARACFADAALADPLSFRAAEALGLAQLKPQSKVPLVEAAATLRRAARLALRDGNRSAAAAAHRSVGEASAERREWALAADAYDEAFKLAPTDCVLSAHLAQARSAIGQHQQAVAALRAALAEDHACLTAHMWLARVLPQAGDLRAALQHARAAIELNPYEEESNELLRGLLAMPGAAEAERGSGRSGSGSGSGGAQRAERARRGRRGSGEAAVADVAASCGEAWTPPDPPASLALPAGCPAPGSGAAPPSALLLPNLFEEGCFHDDLLAKTRHNYHSCGQFNNVLASLLHALALSRLLCRTLLLPGFFVRYGARLTRVSNFEERWLPTSHFFDLSRLSKSFHVRDVDEWRRAQQQGAASGGVGGGGGVSGGGAAVGAALLTQPLLLVRGEGGRGAQRRFFEYHNLSFARAEAATWPHFMQQQSEMRWVRDDDTGARPGYFTHWDAGLGERFWRSTFDGSPHAKLPMLAFDGPPSVGFGMDHLRWDAALRWTRGHLAYVARARAEAAAVVATLFGDAPFLAVHIRRGADRLHDFCHTSWGQRCYGWGIGLRMCYPTTEAVAAQIVAARRAFNVSDDVPIFLATDSPKPELFEDVLGTHGVAYRRYGHHFAATLPDEFALPVDQLVCARAPYFLGNVPSTVTATIVQERDNAGHPRDTTSFFGFEPDELAQFRDGWTATSEFAC